MDCRSLLRALLIGGVATASLAAPKAANAWGDNGHIVVARIADLNLSQAARDGIKDLIADQDIYDMAIAMFADRFKFTDAGKHTKPWHFVDIPVLDGSESYDAARDCNNDDCVVAQIEAQRTILADKHRPKNERILALKFVVHFVGDIHQPLHAAERNGDQGGNKVVVHFLQRREGRLNLHHVWDDEILGENMNGQDPEDYAKQINDQISGANKTAWQNDTSATTWANESHQAAVRFAYTPLPDPSGGHIDLDQAYVAPAQRVVALQLQKGGVRLARLLNDAFKP